VEGVSDAVAETAEPVEKPLEMLARPASVVKNRHYERQSWSEGACLCCVMTSNTARFDFFNRLEGL
jgi:hypothetical protein